MKPPRFLILACGILIACTAMFSLSKTAFGQEPQASPSFDAKGHLLVSLPEAAAFDHSSRFLAVTNFEFYDPRHKGNSVDFWRITGDYFDAKRVDLVKMNFSVPVTRSPQSMVIVR